jgi:transcriptional regulator with XRE-family HTH domain
MAKPKQRLRDIFGENIRIERARRRMTQEALAEHAGISRVHVGAVERAERACTLDVAERIAAALGRDPSELMVVGRQ